MASLTAVPACQMRVGDTDWFPAVDLTETGQEYVFESAVRDQRLLIAHLFDLPVLPFRLAAGGIGLLNPAKISHVTARPPAESGRVNNWPALAAVPDKALPAEWLRWTSRFP